MARPKPSRRKLKVFQAQLGFHDSVVAAPSQAAALRAWGVHQNLFAEGQARITTDAAAIASARAHPGTPLRRPIGSNDPFELEPLNPPKIPVTRRPPSPRPAAKTKTKPEPPPSADRTALSQAEASLRAVDERRKREEADFRARQQRLDAASLDAHTSYVEARKAAAARVTKARQAYREAGGRD